MPPELARSHDTYGVFLRKQRPVQHRHVLRYDADDEPAVRYDPQHPQQAR